MYNTNNGSYLMHAKKNMPIAKKENVKNVENVENVENVNNNSDVQTPTLDYAATIVKIWDAGKKKQAAKWYKKYADFITKQLKNNKTKADRSKIEAVIRFTNGSSDKNYSTMPRTKKKKQLNK